ncbi:MAG TPA: S41 family peptidase [Solirubrobacteraceae bacterium]|nr:S41 family peptidase [Solirubrobacteraceae bacterium]
MRPPARQPLTVVLVALLPVLLLAGVWLGGHPKYLPRFVRDAFVANHRTLVVDEAIERIERNYYRPISSGQLSGASISGMVSSLGDRFSHYLSPKEYSEFSRAPHFTGIGVSVAPDPRGLLISRVFKDSPAQRAGLKAEELIVGVGERTLKGLSSEAAIALIKGRPGTQVKLRIERAHGARDGAGAQRTVAIVRAVVSEPVVASLSRTVRGVKLGVVALATFSPGAHGEVREAVEHELHSGARGLVLDLRSNGGGLVDEAQLIASVFVAKGATIVTTRGRTQPTVTLKASGGAIAGSIPMVVLVDSNTASAAEIVTAALQDHRRATVVGTHTFGKGVFQQEQGLSNGGALDITVGEYFTPNGRNLGGGGVKQGAGITPEVRVGDVDSEHGLDVALSTLAAKLR